MQCKLTSYEFRVSFCVQHKVEGMVGWVRDVGYYVLTPNKHRVAEVEDETSPHAFIEAYYHKLNPDNPLRRRSVQVAGDPSDKNMISCDSLSSISMKEN